MSDDLAPISPLFGYGYGFDDDASYGAFAEFDPEILVSVMDAAETTVKMATDVIDIGLQVEGQAAEATAMNNWMAQFQQQASPSSSYTVQDAALVQEAARLRTANEALVAEQRKQRKQPKKKSFWAHPATVVIGSLSAFGLVAALATLAMRRQGRRANADAMASADELLAIQAGMDDYQLGLGMRAAFASEEPSFGGAFASEDWQ